MVPYGVPYRGPKGDPLLRGLWGWCGYHGIPLHGLYRGYGVTYWGRGAQHMVPKGVLNGTIMGSQMGVQKGPYPI